ncbi:MAG: hypothetical protein Q4Q17_05025 [Tissierellia bacterium]|nr:hypothetical protein [Tissierellia bacterium]
MEKKHWSDIFDTIKALDTTSLLDKGRDMLQSLDEGHVQGKIDSESKYLIMMTEDYLSGEYTEIRKGTLIALLYTLFYTFVPSRAMKHFLGEKTIGRSIFVYGISMAMVYGELQRYKAFLETQKVVEQTEFGTITYYRHRLEPKEKDANQNPVFKLDEANVDDEEWMTK